MEEKGPKKDEKKVDISGSKNVVQDSSIQGNNVHIGDIYYQSPPPGKGPAAGKEQLEDIRRLISRGRVEQAIAALLAIAGGQGKDAADEARLLSSQWQDVSKSERLGVISYSEATVRKNRITQSLLQALNSLEEES